MKCKDAGTMKEGTVPVSLYHPALNDDDVAPVCFGVIASGEPLQRG